MNTDLDNNISIIIPVYNAGSFVSKAVESALIQPEVKEVILIEDGSRDNSLDICTQLAANYEKVRLFKHPGNANKGAGLSRNLGIEGATGDYIAFLDADDYFLPDRFMAERELFKNKPNIDGVYGALGFHFYSEQDKNRFPELQTGNLTTMPGKVPPEELFLSLLWLHPKVNGYFSVDALTVKRNIFLGKTPLFNDLKLHEDTVFLLQLVSNCMIEPGILDRPVGIRGVHGHNRITKNPENSQSRLLMWKYLYDWSAKASKNKYLQKCFEAYVVSEKIKHVKRIPALKLFITHSFSNRYFLTMGVCFNPSCRIALGNFFAGGILFLKVRIQARFFKNNSFIRNYRSYLIQKH
ncbi:glycosyltransferase family 2 protein [Ginsengibacter hankyongi]|uniref:Glycosyltransferase family 2 protein n=1 Tax=Ginsengibacter hankyongi TaxID=2607284 RepID=A0A5J5ICG4_9BACT|nr:glycosyltransferase family 2 protein [Ginsengibacter hankyongi]KAA9036391.1 glycosyltransferase family 2 protein [Ginsengibacter hankyongi]